MIALPVPPLFLTFVFVILKLAHVITWSWLWVTSPLWLGAAFVTAILCLFIAGAAAIAAWVVFLQWLTRPR